MPTPKSNPTMQRLQLGLELKRLREETGVSREEITERLGWHPTKLSRVEQGSATVSATEIEVFAALFEVTGKAADRLRTLGKEARKRGRYGKVSDWARQYVGMEASAAEILIFSEELMPGLLQTREYAHAVAEASVLANPADIDQLVESRVHRRDRLTSSDAPAVSVVLSEAVLRRHVGGAVVMRDQLRLLQDLRKLPHVTIQVLPFSAGAHAAMGTSFTLLRLAETGKTTVYLEDITSSDYLDRPQHIRAYRLVFDRLRVAALGEHETVTMLDRVIKELD
ncbi:transcriptional regulator [Longimycelium tulufanense]|uniref:Transcriptional regulator n=1 Tax=Longimycelium tulufanense TaxID=907463 RepID=A0A8J3CG43_9PSEU|nr:helix-turn-helix transcriptional regulator [Longimycelium tulufanense]GGM73715.1 transcriptional regulator [Longimycelium tulufanense]